MALHMTVRKGQVCRPIVIRSWQVCPLSRAFSVITLVQKISIIDAIRMLFDKDEYFWRGIKLAEFQILAVERIVDVGGAVREFTGITHHGIHGDAARAFVPPCSPL